MRRQIDPRSIILKEAEARRYCRSHTELAKATGMKISTLTKRMRLPGTATLDEIRAICGTVLTEAEAWELITGRTKKK